MTIRSPAPHLQGAALVVLGMICQQTGAAVAVIVFPLVGPIGAVALRICLSALMLWPIARPSLRGHTRRSWATAAAFGLALSGMNVCFYLALERLPLGTAVTIEVLGPLTLSVLAGRRWLAALWAALAFTGVLLLGGGARDLDLLGVLYALGAAALWAAYILLSKRTGAAFPGLSGLAIGMTVGGVAVLPFALATAGGAMWAPSVLLVGAGVALLSSAAPYAVEMLALRRLPAHAFAVLMALAPAIAALAGLVVLGQALSPLEYSGIALVVAAGVGAVRSAAPRAAEPSGPARAA